jgi:hypothetical protein
MGHFEKCPYGQKEQAFKAIGKRSGGSSSTAVVKYKGERIDKKRLRRYINAKQKQDTEFQLASNM